MSKELWEQQREAQILAQMDEATFLQIPYELRCLMKLKSVDEPEWRPIYEADEEWQKKHKTFIEALKEKKQREDEIRAENK